MPVRIFNNIPSLNAQRILGINNDRLASSVERIASGIRVNRGADERPLSAEEIIGKYRDNAALALSSERVEQALEAVMGLEEDASDPAAIARLLSHA